MEYPASKLIETKYQHAKTQRLLRKARNFGAAENLLFLAFLSIVAQAQTVQFVGSGACKQCHSQIFDRWSKTRMANIVVDPAQHPEAIIPDLTKPDSLVKFNKSDIAFVYGGKWKQRYFTMVGDDYFPLGAQWDVTNKIWRPYLVQPGTGWWVPFYPADNLKRPTTLATIRTAIPSAGAIR